MMSDGSLSQAEIEALLEGTEEIDFEKGSDDSGTAPLNTTAIQAFDALVKSSVDRQQSIFSMLLNRPIQLMIESTRAIERNDLIAEMRGNEQIVELSLNFSSGISGHHSYLLFGNVAQIISSNLMGQENVELNDVAINALQEAYSQTIEPLIALFNDPLEQAITIGAATGRITSHQNIDILDSQLVMVTYRLVISGLPDINFYEIYDAKIVDALSKTSITAPSTMEPLPNPTEQSSQTIDSAQSRGVPSAPSIGVQQVAFSNLTPSEPPMDNGNMGMLMDVYMELTVELGRTHRLIKDILSIGEGTIIELDKLAGEPVDILVNHKLIAKGEVVVIDENFGVRVTEIVSSIDRLPNLS